MAVYTLTFESLPKALSKLKVIKKDKVYTLPEAEYLYQELMKQAEEKGLDLNALDNMICVIKIERPDEDDEVSEFDIPSYDPSNPKLSDKISFDLSKERSMLGDSDEDQKLFKKLDEIEEGLMSEFLKPYDPEENVEQTSFKKGRHAKKKKLEWPFTKQKYQTSDEDDEQQEAQQALQRQLEEEAQFMESPIPKESSDCQEVVKEMSVKEDIQPHKPIVKGEATKRFIENSPRKSDSSEIIQNVNPVSKEVSQLDTLQNKPIDKAEFVRTKSDDIQTLVNQLLDVILIPKNQGTSYILDHLIYQPDDSDFVKKAKQDYLKDVYSTQDLESRYLELKSDIQQLQNESNQALNDYYDQVMKRDDSQGLMKEHEQLKAQVKEEYQQRLSQLEQQLDKDYQLSLEAMKERHQQELIDLKQQHKKESQQLDETHKNKKHSGQKDLEEALTAQFKTTWHQKELEGKNRILENKNADLKIGKENILSQLKASLQAKELEEQQFMKAWIKRWNQGIQSKQESFNHAYTLYQDRLDKEAEEKRLKETEAKEERRLKLEEEKVAVDKQRQDASVIQKEAEIKQLNQTIEDLKRQLEAERLENADIQNQFLQTIQDQRYNIHQLMNPSSEEKKETDNVPLSKVKKWLVGGVATALLAVGAVGFGVKAHYDNVAEAQAQQEAQQAQTKKQQELEKTLKDTQASLDEVKKDNQELNKENQKQAKQLESQKKEKDDSK